MTAEPWPRREERDEVVTPFPGVPAPEPLDDDELADLGKLSIFSRAWIRLVGIAYDLPYLLGRLSSKLPGWCWSAVRDFAVGFARLVAMLVHWVHLTEERRFVRQMEDRNQKPQKLLVINQRSRARLLGVGVIAGLWVLANLVLLFFPRVEGATYGRYAEALWLQLVALVGACEWVGHKPREDDGPVRRHGALTHGTSTRTLRRDLEEGFAAKKMYEVGVIGMTVNKYGWHGVFETELDITDQIVEHLERWVHAPRGSLLVQTDEKNAASHPFQLLIDDPLAEPVTPEDDADLDIRRRQRVGRHLFGKPLAVNMRQHIGLIGRSGSGKSSGLWILIDRIVKASNARWSGIDVSNGPALPVWARTAEAVAYDPESAASLLDGMISLAESRNAELRARAESDDDSEIDENWNPTPAQPAHYLVIDEFHIVADDKDLLKKVKRLARVGRKAAVYLVLATPGASKDDMGATVIKGMIGLKILFACIMQDITNFLGGSMAALGWRPDKLAPAAAGSTRDAGKAYVWDGDHQDPEIVRFGRLDLGQCRTRARAAAPPRGAETPEEASERPLEERALQVLADALDHFEQERLPSSWLERYVTQRYGEQAFPRVRAGLRQLGVTARPIGAGVWEEVNPRGFRREDTRSK